MKLTREQVAKWADEADPWEGRGRLAFRVVALAGDWLALSDEVARLRTALDRCDRAFDGWSYDDVFGRVDKMRLIARTALLPSTDTETK